MEPLGRASFRFACHPGVVCYMKCCRDQNLRLYPADIIRLKRRLGLTAGEFLERHALVVRGDNPFFPTVMLQMADNPEKTCPFLGEQGCMVYEDRPNACRTYPLERAVARAAGAGRAEEFYFLTNHPYCLGHQEDRQWTVNEWLRGQRLLDDNLQLDQWAVMDTLFATNPWHGEGAAGPMQRLAFMACYNIDNFRQYVQAQGLMERLRLNKARQREIMAEDAALLRFAYEWLQQVLVGR
ncbi:MAG: Fe-S oxidoreductase [Desulfobacterales bacterium CG2_30_60_27]|nr:MAG: Fe-S oxidoreductase [Desulfobacterales bacterium CG2_30_60_27]